jgi:hypothetical protein
VELRPIETSESIHGGINGAFTIRCMRYDNGEEITIPTSKVMIEIEKDLRGRELTNFRRSTVNTRRYSLDVLQRDIGLGRYKGEN